MFSVNEIFYSIEGEGIRAGYPCVFVRFNGCNLHCKYCDTGYAQRPGIPNMDVSDIVSQVKEYNCPRVTLTGGEPLLQKGIDKLVDVLVHEDIEVNIETNGSIPLDLYYWPAEGVLFTVDYKTGASGESSKMYMENFQYLCHSDVIKFVVGSKEDIRQAFDVVDKYLNQWNPPMIFFSPVFGEIEPKDIVEAIKQSGHTECRVQLQLHKFIWPPEQRGV